MDHLETPPARQLLPVTRSESCSLLRRDRGKSYPVMLDRSHGNRCFWGKKQESFRELRVTQKFLLSDDDRKIRWTAR